MTINIEKNSIILLNQPHCAKATIYRNSYWKCSIKKGALEKNKYYKFSQLKSIEKFKFVTQ